MLKHSLNYLTNFKIKFVSLNLFNKKLSIVYFYFVYYSKIVINIKITINVF